MVPKNPNVATKTSKVATLIYQYFIQILLNIINHCSFWIIGTKKVQYIKSEVYILGTCIL